MKFNDYIFEDLKIHKWELNSSYSFEKNKVFKVETKKFTKEDYGNKMEVSRVTS